MSLHLPADASESLPGLIDRAALTLTNARSSAEILEAKELAGLAFDAAKRRARIAKASKAHDTVLSAVRRAQADALEIEAAAKRRLADEYDAAQERGEVVGPADRHSTSRVKVNKATAAEIGLTHKSIHEARTIRDAEQIEPGIVRRALNEKLNAGENPTRAAIRDAVTDAALRGLRSQRSPPRKNPLYVPPSAAGAAWTHVYGTARAIVEWATDANVKLALNGLNERDDNQTANIKAVRDCAGIFNKIAGAIDAE